MCIIFPILSRRAQCQVQVARCNCIDFDDQGLGPLQEYCRRSPRQCLVPCVVPLYHCMKCFTSGCKFRLRETRVCTRDPCHEPTWVPGSVKFPLVTSNHCIPCKHCITCSAAQKVDLIIFNFTEDQTWLMFSSREAYRVVRIGERNNYLQYHLS